MENLLVFFVIFDPWRMLLSVGLSMILLGSLWFTKGNEGDPYDLVKQAVGQVALPSVVWLFVCTGFFGFPMPWLIASPLARDFGFSGMLEIAETVMYCGGGYCLWRVRSLLKCRNASLKSWTGGAVCFFLLAAILWIVRWDALVVAATDWARILPKTIHLLLSAMTAGGLVVMVIGFLSWEPSPTIREPLERNEIDEDQWRIQIVRFGMAWVLIGVVPQVVVGSWLLVALGEEVRNHFLNGLTSGSLLFFFSLLVALLGLVLINAAFIAPYVKGLVWGGWLNIFSALFLMGFIRYESIGASLAPLNTGTHWVPLSFWHYLTGVLAMLVLLVLLVKGLRVALISCSEKPTA